ncbi:hypothetical protein PAESOLCIP111_05622 [Paenibacillus solanacearum]|uniref:Uncharacterized protein n=1 Tax=Paenibacillus solanacearum TaxID=2048548 RepID=A0A916K6H2_9BACL|nr:hypothetical protein [Paenibacillus solanacearum]CAG7648552.1 hypothetical protein PAESOLCIP111_05622 [Paenibacillus solanacearum]
MKFLLRHYTDLNLPYDFAVKLSFISSPLLFGKAMLILSEEDYDVVGAAGFVYGTGPNGYEDRHICQVEVAYLRPEYRRTTLFMQGLLKLLGEIQSGGPEVEIVQFWVTEGQSEEDKLFSKFIGLPGSKRFLVNGLACHQVLFRELEDYCSKFKKRFRTVAGT